METLITYISKKFNVDARYFITGGFWLLVAQISTVLSSMIVAVLFAKYLTEINYGIYRYIIGLAALLSVFSLTGMPSAILQATSKGYGNFINSCTKTSLMYSLGVSIVSLIGSIYYFLMGNPTLTYGCLIIAILHPVSQLFLNTQSHLYGKLEFSTGAYMQGFKSVFVSGSSIVTLLLTQNILALLFVYFVSQAIAAIASHFIYTSHTSTISGEPIPDQVKEKYLNYAKNTSYRNVIVGIAARLDSIIIFQYLGAAELALYSISTLLPDQIKASLKNLQTLLLPKYTKHESIETLKKAVPMRSLQLFVVLVIVTIGFIIVIEPIYLMLFPKYADGLIFVQLLATSFPASIFLIPVGALQAQHKEKELYIFHMSTSVVQILFLVTLTISFGLIGAVGAKIISQYFRTVVSYFLLFRSFSSDKH